MKAKLIFYGTMIAIYTGIMIINITIASSSGCSTTSFPILEYVLEAWLICLFVCPFSCFFARHYTVHGMAYWHYCYSLLLQGISLYGMMYWHYYYYSLLS